MSKILVLDDKQFREVRAIYEETMRNSMVPQDMKITSFYHSIRCAFDDAEKKSRSVLEWHPVTEKPKDASSVLVKFHDDFIFSGVVFVDDDGWCCYGCTRDQIKEWAYLPSEEENEQTSN